MKAIVNRYRISLLPLGLLLVFLCLSSVAGKACTIETEVEDAVLKGDWNQAMERLKSEDSNAQNPIARLIMGHACLATNRNNQSLLLFLSVEDKNDLDRWLTWSESLVRHHPQSPIAHYLLGDAKARMGNLDGAIEEFNQSLKRDEEFALALNSRGVIYTIMNKVDEAVIDLSSATQIRPDLADAWANLGSLYILQEAPQGALEVFDKAIGVNPEFALAYNGRGCAKFGQGDLDGAVADFDTASRLFPPLIIAEVNHGLTAARAAEIVTIASIERKPGTTLEGTFKELRQRQQSHYKDLSQRIKTQALLDTDFTHISNKKLWSLVDQYGLSKVNTAMALQLDKFRNNIRDNRLQMQEHCSKFPIADVNNAKWATKLHAADRLTSTGYRVLPDQMYGPKKGWSPYIKPFDTQLIADSSSIQDLPEAREVRQWGRELRHSAMQDLMNWPVDILKSAVMPHWARNLKTGYDLGKGMTQGRSHPTSPSEALDRFKPLAALGGPSGGLLIPLLKGYYGMVFDALGSIDIESQMRSLDRSHQPKGGIGSISSPTGGLWKGLRPFSSPSYQPGGAPPGGITMDMSRGFVDKGNWPVLTYFTLVYKPQPVLCGQPATEKEGGKNDL